MPTAILVLQRLRQFQRSGSEIILMGLKTPAGASGEVAGTNPTHAELHRRCHATHHAVLACTRVGEHGVGTAAMWTKERRLDDIIEGRRVVVEV